MSLEPSQPRASILVVDDTIENLRLLSALLAEQGYEVRPVTNARLALQAVEHAPPDLILLDINMPEMDGFEACKQLRARGAQDTPILFLTAQTAVEDKVKAFSVGGSDYITKPFHVDEVLARVKCHLALRRARTELEMSYRELGRLEKLRDDLVHMIVHDMRSPLSALLCHLEFLMTDATALLNEESREDLRHASKAATTLSHMANDLLDISRLEAGRFPLQKVPTELVALATQVTAGLAGLDRSRALLVEALAPIECVCDGVVIRRVLENLVSNAIKHTPKAGTVQVAVSAAAAHVRVEVQDEGPGVPPEARDKIFEKFGSMAARKEGAFHSVGLGLAFCKLAVTAHGGAIGVLDGATSGSVFWFELPCE